MMEHSTITTKISCANALTQSAMLHMRSIPQALFCFAHAQLWDLCGTGHFAIYGTG